MIRPKLVWYMNEHVSNKGAHQSYGLKHMVPLVRNALYETIWGWLKHSQKGLIIELYWHYCVPWSNELVLWNKLSEYVHMLFIILLIIFFVVDEHFAQMNALNKCSLSCYSLLVQKYETHCVFFSLRDNHIFIYRFISCHSDEKKISEWCFRLKDRLIWNNIHLR